MDISPIDRVYVHIPITAKLYDGSPATLTGVDVAALPYRTDPTASTTWTRGAYDGATAVVLVAGPDADPTGAVPIPAGGAALWVRVIDSPEVQAIRVAVISVR